MKKCRKPLSLRHFGTPGGIRTHGLSLRSTENRLIHAVLRCYAMSLNPLKYKAFRRTSCFSVSPDFVPFFRLFWRPVSKMLAETRRETNSNELWFESQLSFHATTLIGKLFEKDNFASIHAPSRSNVKKRYASPAIATRMHTAFFHNLFPGEAFRSTTHILSGQFPVQRRGQSKAAGYA